MPPRVRHLVRLTVHFRTPPSFSSLCHCGALSSLLFFSVSGSYRAAIPVVLQPPRLSQHVPIVVTKPVLPSIPFERRCLTIAATHPKLLHRHRLIAVLAAPPPPKESPKPWGPILPLAGNSLAAARCHHHLPRAPPLAPLFSSLFNSLSLSLSLTCGSHM